MSVKSLIKFEYELRRKKFSFGSALHYKNPANCRKNFSFGSALHDKNPKEHVKATLCLVIYHTIFDLDQPFTIQSPKPSRSKAL